MDSEDTGKCSMCLPGTYQTAQDRVGMGESLGGKILNLNPQLKPAEDQIFAAGTRYSKRKQEQVRDEHLEPKCSSRTFSCLLD